MRPLLEILTLLGTFLGKMLYIVHFQRRSAFSPTGHLFLGHFWDIFKARILFCAHMPGFAIESLSWCVLGMLSTYLDINGLTAFGVTTKFIKDLAVVWLKNRAMCCLDHVNRPEDWEFFFKEITRPPALIADHGGWPFWAVCFQCTKCEDCHLLNIKGGEEAVSRRSVLSNNFEPDRSLPHFADLMVAMSDLRVPVRMPSGRF